MKITNQLRVVNQLPTAILLSPVKDVNAGMDTRNISYLDTDISKFRKNLYYYTQLQKLKSNTHPMGKIAIAKMCLDEILYPDEQTSKFTMSPVRGGLFRGWNSDGSDDDDDDNY